MSIHNAMSPNQREGLTAVSSITGKNEYVFSTGHALNTTATIAGSALPISGATTAVGVAIVDGSGNQITSFGGGTQYAELTTTTPGTGTLALGRYKSSAPTLTDGQMYGLELDSSGNLKVSGSFTTTPPSDIAPATQNITVVDSGSTTTAAANGQNFITGTATANSTASFSLSSIETIRVEVTGVWTGTLIAEASLDGGTTWVAQGLHQGAYTTSTFIANFVGGANIAGATNFRIRATATITGTATVKVIESVNTQSVYIANAAPAGTVVSLLNSTSATLLSGAAFTGTGEDVANFSEMRVTVFANVASATNGLSLQQSTDNTNWDVVDVYTIPVMAAGEGKTFVVPRQARYFRIVYTNGGTNQTTFRLQVILNRTATAPSSNRASDGYTNETDLVQNQTFGMLYNNSTWDRARGDTTAGAWVQVKAALPAGSAIIGALVANQSVNVAQINGVTPLMGNGVTGTGSQRVTIASDNTPYAIKIDQTTPGTTNGISIAQIGSTTVATGNGVVGTGVQRVAIASDNTAFSVNATLSAETTKVIGTVNQGTSPWVTSLSSTTITSEVPGTGATNLGKAEDAAHTTGDTGVMALAVRNDNAATSTTNANADYSQISTDITGTVFTRAAPSNTSTLANVGGSVTSVTLLAANAARRTVVIYNDSTSDLYVKWGTTASATSFTLYCPSLGTVTWGGDDYAGIVTGIWISATGNARTTETTI